MANIPEDLNERIKDILIDRLFLEIAAEDLTDNESLTEAHGVDSVRLFDMVVGLEEDFDISFEDDELMLKNFDTVSAIAQRVSAKLQDED